MYLHPPSKLKIYNMTYYSVKNKCMQFTNYFKTIVLHALIKILIKDRFLSYAKLIYLLEISIGFIFKKTVHNKTSNILQSNGRSRTKMLSRLQEYLGYLWRYDFLYLKRYIQVQLTLARTIMVPLKKVRRFLRNVAQIMSSVLTILLACIGTWGQNCRLNCTFGFFGFGCRQKCECSTEQFCDRKDGCIDINTIESKFHDFNQYKLVNKYL